MTVVSSSPAPAGQRSLFGSGPPHLDRSFAALRRHHLTEGAWVDYQPGWLSGHDSLFEALMEVIEWEQHRRVMYDRVVEVPRLLGSMPAATVDRPELDVINHMAAALDARYATRFDRVGFALYRDGADSVAWHGDQVARELHEALVATVSLGEPRRFGLRPKGGGPTRYLRLGHGDLVVMGGTCQRTWEHGVAKVARAGPRLAVMFRPGWAHSWMPQPKE